MTSKTIDFENADKDTPEDVIRGHSGMAWNICNVGEEGTCVIFGHGNRKHLKPLKDVELGETIKIKSQGIAIIRQQIFAIIQNRNGCRYRIFKQTKISHILRKLLQMYRHMVLQDFCNRFHQCFGFICNFYSRFSEDMPAQISRILTKIWLASD